MHGFKKLGLRLILAAAFAWLISCPLCAQGPNGESTKDPLLDTLNSEFQVQYRQALAATLAQAGPLILEEGDNLILVHHGERASVLVKPVEQGSAESALFRLRGFSSSMTLRTKNRRVSGK